MERSQRSGYIVWTDSADPFRILDSSGPFWSGTMILLSWFGAKAIVASGNQTALGLTTGELASLITYAMENITAFVVATLSFYTVGFALMFGKSLFGLVGTSYWLLFHLNSQYDYIFVLYQMMLAATSITIFAGSMGVVTLIWVVCGFSLAFGTDVHGLIGNFQYAFLNGVGMVSSSTYGPTIPFIAFFAFQLMFAVITPALITGAFADRISFKSYLIFLVVWSLLVYIPIVHWVWGGGFLQKMGVIDFAGGLTVHGAAVAAISAVVIILVRRFLLHCTQDHLIDLAHGVGVITKGPPSIP